MAEVIPVFGGPDHEADAAAQEEVIFHLERLLDRTRRGEIRSIVYVTVDSNQATTNGWCGYDRHNGRFSLAYSVGLLFHKFYANEPGHEHEF